MLFAPSRPGQFRFDFARKPASTAGWVKREEAIMGTAITVELWAEERRAGEVAAAAVMAEMHRIDQAMSPHKPLSELSRINRSAGHSAVALSAEMAHLVERALHFSRLSDGAFDISYAASGQLYDYRAGVAPSEAALAQAQRAVGWQHLHFDATARTLRFGLPGMRIDLGGFAKGHAVDNACRILKRHGVQHAWVAAGGDSRVMGSRPAPSGDGRRPWTIAIRDPRRPGEVVAVLPLEDTAISTSGDYERFFDAGPTRHHHIVNPATGRSPQGVRSVTVLADDGLTSEALGKCVFVLGVQRGLALVNRQPGVDAVVVCHQGLLHRSQGLLQAEPAAA